MAGSLGYSLKVANIYQRRFDAESFAAVLAGSHLYIYISASYIAY